MGLKGVGFRWIRSELQKRKERRENPTIEEAAKIAQEKEYKNAFESSYRKGRLQAEHRRGYSTGLSSSSGGDRFISGLKHIQSGVGKWQKYSTEFSKTFPGLTSSAFGGSSMFGSAPRARHHKVRHHKAKASRRGKTITIRI